MVAQNREPLASLLLYRLSKWSIITPTFHTYFRGRTYGVEKVPRLGGAIAVANHASYFDPPILACSLNRPVAFMAKQELFEIPLLKNAIAMYGAYPVNRSQGDRAALRAATKAIESGWIAGIFLGGTRTPDGKIHDPKLGAALIAAKTQVPLIPISLWGTEKILSTSSFPKPVPLTIRIGDLIEPPKSSKREDLQEVTNKCTEAINSLHNLGR